MFVTLHLPPRLEVTEDDIIASYLLHGPPIGSYQSGTAGDKS